MKNKKLDYVSDADDKYLSESDPENFTNTVKRKSKPLKFVLIAAALCMLIIASSLVLFIPFKTDKPSIGKYKDSEYYPIIDILNDATFTPPLFKNNFEKLSAALKSISPFKGKGANTDANTKTGGPVLDGVNTTFESTYKEVTDNQHKGVIEADKIKRSDSRIFYMYGAYLFIYSIEKEDTHLLGTYSFQKNFTIVNNDIDFYLSADCKTLTAILPTKDFKTACLTLVSLDVSDPANITVKGKVTLSGAYISSRMTEGKLLLVSGYTVNKRNIDFDDESTYLPQIDVGNGMESIKAEDITVPDNILNLRYTVLTTFDMSSLSPTGAKAFFSYTDDIYATDKTVYLFRVYQKNDDRTCETMTEITSLDYSNGIEKKGTITVRGYVKDQYSLDEYNGILRVVTTTNLDAYYTGYYTLYDSSENLMRAWGDSNASLYCIDAETFEIISSVIDFAPPREEVQSVRFDKDVCYVCTSIERSDPVFFFDLSDINNITYKDTGTIDGYSTSLINFGDGYSLGIGVGGHTSFKVEIYEEGANGVVSVCSYEDNVSYSTDYKSYYIDRENRMIGLCTQKDKISADYLVLYFDGYNLIEKVNTPLNTAPSLARGVLIDGYMYMFGNNDFKVVKVFE